MIDSTESSNHHIWRFAVSEMLLMHWCTNNRKVKWYRWMEEEEYRGEKEIGEKWATGTFIVRKTIRSPAKSCYHNGPIGDHNYFSVLLPHPEYI